MTVDVENELTRVLRTRAAGVGMHPDPWTRYSAPGGAYRPAAVGYATRGWRSLLRPPSPR